MNEALWVLAGVATWAVITGVDALAGRTKQRLRRAELRVKNLEQQLSGTSKALNRENSRRSAALIAAESRHLEEVDGLNAKIKALEEKVKEQQMMLNQKWKEATAGGNTENG